MRDRFVVVWRFRHLLFRLFRMSFPVGPRFGSFFPTKVGRKEVFSLVPQFHAWFTVQFSQRDRRNSFSRNVVLVRQFDVCHYAATSISTAPINAYSFTNRPMVAI